MATDYTWTDPDLANELAGVDAFEVAGCVHITEAAGPGITERTDNRDEATFFSVYRHRDGVGSACIADRNTLEEATTFGTELADRLGVPCTVEC